MLCNKLLMHHTGALSVYAVFVPIFIVEFAGDGYLCVLFCCGVKHACMRQKSHARLAGHQRSLFRRAAPNHEIRQPNCTKGWQIKKPAHPSLTGRLRYGPLRSVPLRSVITQRTCPSISR
jgi:hypothetical protein